MAYYQKKDYANAAKWTQRYFKEGGNDAADAHRAAAELLPRQRLQQREQDARQPRSTRAPPTAASPPRTSCRSSPTAISGRRTRGGYVAAIEKLVIHYPKKQYWTDLLARVQKKPGFSDRLGVHVYRLRFATGNLATANDYMEMAQLALQSGVPAEAKVVMDKGYAEGVLGKGDQAERHGRLRDLVTKSLEQAKASRANEEKEALAAKDGDALVKVGLNYVYEGDAQKGFRLIEQGIKKGGLKRPEDAKLRLGEAQLHAGQKQRGVQTLREVRGRDGAADIARLWVLHARA